MKRWVTMTLVLHVVRVLPILTIASTTLFAQYDRWYPVTLPYTGMMVQDVEFNTSDSGFVSSFQSELFRTVSGGKVWEQVALPFVEITSASKLQYLQGGVWMCFGAMGVAMSSDFGSTWHLTKPAPWSIVFLIDCWFADSMNGVIVDVSSQVAVTTSGGASWEELDVPIHHDGPWVCASISNSGIVCIGSTSGVLAMSSTTGASWEEYVADSVAWEQIQFVTDSFVIACGKYAPTNEGRVGISRDGGNTWAISSVPGSKSLVRIDFLDSTRGLMSDDEVGLYLTKDAGDTWTLINTSEFPNSICVVNDSLAYATTNRLLLKTVADDSTVGVVQQTKSEVSSLRLWPNPTDLWLHVQVPERWSTITGPVTYSIYSVTGNTLQHGKVWLDSTPILISVRSLSDGVYYLRAGVKGELVTGVFAINR